jgi:hypothetical protein
MGCFIAIFALFSPRLALFFILVFSDWISHAFEGGWVLPVLGFFLLPWTTLAYTAMWEYGRNGVHGFEWFIVILFFLGDLGAYGSSSKLRTERA